MSIMSGATKRINIADGAVRLIPENPNRKRLIVQVVSGGNAWYNGANPGVAVNFGLKILPGSSFFDDPPFVHCGEVWTSVDADGTVVYFAEWV